MASVTLNSVIIDHAVCVVTYTVTAVVIGFKNPTEVVVEGGTTSVCAEVKPEGLRLDPFDRVPLSIVRVNPGLYH